MRTLSNLASLVDQYDYFLIDLWGTVHDGKRLFPGIQEQLQHLKQHKKQVIFVSNTPRPRDAIFPLLTSLGLTSKDYDALITSGDVFLEYVQKDPSLQKPFYYLGDTLLHAPLLERLHTPSQTLEEAAYILCSAVPPNYEPILKEALRQQKHFICINPDLVVVEDGRSLVCPGSLAQEYANKGGYVTYYGKPHSAIYDYVFQKLGAPEKAKALMIGDGIYTDILGAHQYGIDSLLVNTGVHRILDNFNPAHALEKLCQDLEISPTYFIESLGQN